MPTTEARKQITRRSLEIALAVENGKAKRLLSKDGLGFPNKVWATQHRKINDLLTSWQRL